jgi:hypothetical protein
MPNWAKVLLALAAAAAVAGALVIGGVVWWFANNKDKIAHDSQDAQMQGKAFGATHARGECIDAGLEHVKACGQLNVMCEAMENIRLHECMSVARDDGACKAVPQQSAIVKEAFWGNEECARRGLAGSQACGRYMGTVTRECANAH